MNESDAREAAAEWNRYYPPGTEVIVNAWLEGHTNSEAYAVGIGDDWKPMVTLVNMDNPVTLGELTISDEEAAGETRVARAMERFEKRLPAYHAEKNIEELE